MTTKYAIDATMMTPVVTCDRFASLTRPVDERDHHHDDDRTAAPTQPT